MIHSFLSLTKVRGAQLSVLTAFAEKAVVFNT